MIDCILILLFTTPLIIAIYEILRYKLWERCPFNFTSLNDDMHVFISNNSSRAIIAAGRPAATDSDGKN